MLAKYTKNKHTTFIILVQKVDRGMLIPHAYLLSSDHRLSVSVYQTNPEPSVCCCQLCWYKTSNKIDTELADAYPQSSQSCYLKSEMGNIY